MSKLFKCSYCGRADFLSSRGLTQHIAQNNVCKEREKAEINRRPPPAPDAGNYMKVSTVEVSKRQDKRLCMGETPAFRCYNTWPNDNENMGYTSEHDDAAMAFCGDVEDTEDAMDDSGVPDKLILQDFVKYVRKAEVKFHSFSQKEEKAIELMAILRESKASLETYNKIMAWHLRASGRIRDHENPANHVQFLNRQSLINRLLVRYNLKDNVNKIEEITLPSSRAKATIIKNDARWCLQSLLTDPRITDNDYLFFDDNPLSPPPDDLENFPIGDINTGLAFQKSYQKLIKDPTTQQIMPIIFYIDGAATGQFADLPVTALKFTLGIFNRKAREKPHLWRTLGYVPTISKEKSKGRRTFKESGHVDAHLAHPDMLEEEGNLPEETVSPAQDLHTMLATILREFLEIQEKGFEWDLMYKGKLYKGIEFVVFIPFIKADTDEADRLCGSYTSRTKFVAQLCRYCCCPTSESDQPRARYAPKTQPMISALVKKDDVEGLRLLSQQRINNAFYTLRFGAHNEAGVHGACPLEMLHALLLGIFKYVRDCFFDQIGENSRLADEINALAVEYGELFTRQSDRNMPKTKFSEGLQKGKLMAKEYSGVLLILAAILRSTRGRELLEGRKNSKFAQSGGVDDWMMLVETLIMWEQWLKSDEMDRKHVRRAQKKHLYLMYLVRRVANRRRGMGMKMMKYHGIMHMVEDIYNFGVPMNYDTGADESGHKPSKTAAKLTQKRKDTFDKQVSQRLTEVQALDLAMAEMKRYRPLWEYYCPENPDVMDQHGRPKEGIFGARYVTTLDDEGENSMAMLTNKRVRPTDVEQPFIDFVAALSKKVAQYIPELEVVSTYRDKNGNLFRGTNEYQGRPWRDWVMVDWGAHGVLPCKIWGFVDLRRLPQNNDVRHGGLRRVDPEIYAIVESADQQDESNETHRSEIFIPLLKNVAAWYEDTVTDLEFYLADVGAFDGPITVIPDVGGPNNGYFLVRQREEWSENFARWLERPHEDFEDFEEDSSEESDDDQSESDGEDSDSSG